MHSSDASSYSSDSPGIDLTYNKLARRRFSDHDLQALARDLAINSIVRSNLEPEATPKAIISALHAYYYRQYLPKILAQISDIRPLSADETTLAFPGGATAFPAGCDRAPHQLILQIMQESFIVGRIKSRYSLARASAKEDSWERPVGFYFQFLVDLEPKRPRLFKAYINDLRSSLALPSIDDARSCQEPTHCIAETMQHLMLAHYACNPDAIADFPHMHYLRAQVLAVLVAAGKARQIDGQDLEAPLEEFYRQLYRSVIAKPLDKLNRCAYDFAHSLESGLDAVYQDQDLAIANHLQRFLTMLTTDSSQPMLNYLLQELLPERYTTEQIRPDSSLLPYSPSRDTDSGLHWLGSPGTSVSVADNPVPDVLELPGSAMPKATTFFELGALSPSSERHYSLTPRPPYDAD